MKKFKISIVFILLVSTNLFAQYSTDWIRPAESYQKIGVMIARDNQDNVIATGYWTSNNMLYPQVQQVWCVAVGSYICIRHCKQL